MHEGILYFIGAVNESMLQTLNMRLKIERILRYTTQSAEYALKVWVYINIIDSNLPIQADFTISSNKMKCKTN
jgi:hypothetical protein